MEITDLYQDLIIDHGTQPRNFHIMHCHSHSAKGFNPLCGDKVNVYLKIDEKTKKILDVSFSGQGCAISTASASIMTELLKNTTIADAQKLFTYFQSMVTDNTKQPPPNLNLDKLKALAGIKQFPTRIKCATLAWHTLIAAINNSEVSFT